MNFLQNRFLAESEAALNIYAVARAYAWLTSSFLSIVCFSINWRNLLLTPLMSFVWRVNRVVNTRLHPILVGMPIAVLIVASSLGANSAITSASTNRSELSMASEIGDRFTICDRILSIWSRLSSPALW